MCRAIKKTALKSSELFGVENLYIFYFALMPLMNASKHLSKDALAEVFTLAFAEAFLTFALAALAATALTALFLLLAAATALALEAGALAAATALALEAGALAAAADFADLLPKCLTNANGTLADLILLKSKLKFGNKVQWLYWADNCLAVAKAS